MPEEKTVDIDTTGPGAEIEIKETENENEKIIEDSPRSDDTSEKLDEQLDVRDSKDIKEPEKKEEIKEQEIEDSFFNQDIDYNEGIRSPGWARLQKKKLTRIKWIK